MRTQLHIRVFLVFFLSAMFTNIGIHYTVQVQTGSVYIDITLHHPQMNTSGI